MLKTFTRIGVAVTAAAVLTLVTACSGGGAGAGDDADTIVLQTNWTSAGTESKPLKAAIEKFTEETGITVKTLENGDDLNQVYETSLLAGEEADVLLVGLLEKQLDWVKTGAVVPVDKYLTDWGIDKALPKDAVADWTDADGALRGFPYAGFTWPWWYNTAVFEQAGVEIPKTTDELIAAMPALKAAGFGGVAIGGNDWSGQKIFLQIIQSYLKPTETEKLFQKGGYCDNADAMKGVELFTKLRDAGVFVDGVEGLSADQATALYQTGKAAIAPMGSWSYNSTEEALANTTTLGGFPAVSGGTFEAPTAYHGSTSAGWWISPNGEKKIDNVEKFVKFMYSPETVQSMIEGGIDIVTTQKVDVSNVKSPLVAQAFSKLPDAVDFAVMPDLFIPADVSNPMYRATSIAYTAGNDAKLICKTVDDVYAVAAN